MIGALLITLFAVLYYGPWLKKVISTFLYQYPYLQKLPGPKGPPFIGSIADLAGDTTVPLKFWLSEAEKARERGDGFFTITVLGRTISFPINGETLKYICESNEEILKGKDYEFLRAWIGDCILLVIGKEWRDRRKSYTPLFHFSQLDGYLETFNKHARVMAEVLHDKAGTIVDMSEAVKRTALDVICDTAMGINFDTQRNPTHPYLHSVHDFTHLQQRHNTTPHMWITPIWYLLYDREYKRSLHGLNDLTKKIMDERFRRVQNGEVDLEAKKRPLIDHFFSYQQKGDWTLEDVHYELNGVIFGGHDTTSATLTWVYWVLGTQAEFQQQCFEEINDIMGPTDRDLDHDDLKSMVFLERFIKECMRIFPPIPAVERELMNDFKIGDHVLPKGSEIFIAPHIVHHNPEVYPEPWKFDPDRFLPENIAKRNPYDFIPFSAGPRNCIGQKFAMQEMKTILSWTLRKFSFSTKHDMLDQGFAIEVICKPTINVDLLVTPRK
ncbi:hypothetical protein PENTCL1PPCAC_18797 [Pristionchus entomophagus]|uniref:Cytochrome P450 n=1 Tax=Pristionchus entomophagus TaxID=358040 RepID=A0AAV5TQX2_9BILA|nr:hypothetical protein PENTCL1PPCAC_18797 [Pristionchus entomophagus]